MRLAASLALLAIVACRGTEPFVAVPTAITVAPGNASFTALGATRQFVAIVTGQNGAPIPGQRVHWATLDSLVATVDDTGVLTTQGIGTTQIQASFSVTSDTLTASADVAVSQVPRQLVKTSGDGLTDTTAATLQIPVVVRVQDSLAHPIPGIAVTFAVTQGGGRISATADTSDAGGFAAVSWTLGGASGSNALLASVAGSGILGNPATFLATAVLANTVASVVRFAGDSQTGLMGFTVNVPPAVLLRSAAGTPIAGATVAFAVAGGGGSITGGTALTNANGVATVGSWSLTAGANALRATVTSSGLIVGNPLTFTATGAQKRYRVDVRFLTPMTGSQQTAFINAANRWETLIYGDVPDIPVSIASGRCGSNAPALNETIDDIVILASIDSIDGPGKILGQAGPCALRSGSRLPLLGEMEFDMADADTLEAQGQLELVIEHEMGHVLGYGTIWGSSVLVGAGGSDPHFVGVQALAAFDRVGGAAYTGAKVPVENCCGSGTRDAHWRETILISELMTGFLNSGTNPLSVLTTASMGDLGYQVNYAGSDPYVLSVSLAVRPAPLQALGNDILRLPMMEIDPTGRILRVIFPK